MRELSCSGLGGRRRLVPEDSSGYIQNDTETLSGLQAAFPSALLSRPSGGGTVQAGSVEKEGCRMRADAKRNYDKLVETAGRVFREKGYDAPLDDIAKQ